MNSKVCVVTILFLSLENVSGLICWPKQQQPSTGKPEDKCSKRTRANTCNPQKCHEWHQRYQNGLQIGTANIQKWGKRTLLTITVEKFDNNTEIYCENSKENTNRSVQDHTVNVKINSNLQFDSNNDESYKKLIKIEANETWEKSEEPPNNTIIYSKENENITFRCPESSNTTYIQLGIIDTTSNTIETFGSTHEIELNITHNGTILCCISYVLNETKEEMRITRVVNKTLLHYNDTARQDSREGAEITTTNSTVTNSDAYQGHQTIIITTAVAVVFILLVIIVLYYITCKKRCRKKPQSEAKVLYADLDFLRQIQPDNPPRSGPAEECPYAQIIGEIRPQTT